MQWQSAVVAYRLFTSRGASRLRKPLGVFNHNVYGAFEWHSCVGGRAYGSFQWQPAAVFLPRAARVALANAAQSGSGLQKNVLRLPAQLRTSWLNVLEAIKDGKDRRVAAFAASIFCSSAGQKLLAAGVPIFLGAWAVGPTRSFCRDVSVPGYVLQLDFHRSKAEILFIELVQLVTEELRTWMRCMFLATLFTPVIVTAPLCAMWGWYWREWVELLRWTLEHAGPAFIKWGQWAATRADLFPHDVCESLAKLQTNAPAHSFQVTRQTVERALHAPLEVIFDSFDEKPIASGSIAQVHRAVLSARGAANTEYAPKTTVAVKVRHPGVSEVMQRDVMLMQRAAKLTKFIPGLSAMRLDESIRQFGAPLKEQLDLEAEARHLQRFNRNFRRWHNLSFPKPIFPYVRCDVLVETFEEGRLISTYVDRPYIPGVKQALANLGMNCYLKMLLKDNYIHGDLHPGNILVRLVDPNTPWGRVANVFNIPTSPHLVLLDVGMVAQLTPDDQRNLVHFFKAVTKQDGGNIGRSILALSDQQSCPDPQAFVGDMKDLFDSLTLEQVRDHTSEVIADILERVRRHQVDIKGIISTVVVTTLVLEGWSTKLNPDIRILETLKELLPKDWNERITRMAEKAMSTDYPAILS